MENSTMNDASASQARALRTLAANALLPAFALAALGAASHAAAQQTVWVQNNGVDGAVCGTQARPCRSISRALAAAQPGATILVGPGRYGDINRNGLFDQGDEGPTAQPVGDVRWSVLRLTKSVRLSSTHGAEVTTIDIGPDVSPTGAPRPRRAVTIHSNDVFFGTAGHGFRVTGGMELEDGGVWVRDGADNVRVSGNIVEGVRSDGNYTGSGVRVAGGSSQILITDNQVLYSIFGVSVELTVPENNSLTDGPVSVLRNTLRYNYVGAGLVGKGITFSANIADGNRQDGIIGSDEDQSDGGAPDDPSRPRIAIRDNWITSNAQLGLWLGPSGPIVRNAILGNIGGGLGTYGALERIELNNIYGNGEIPGGPTDQTNCGVFVSLFGSAVATNNYWGASTGPGPNPADDSGVAGAGESCEGSPRTLDTPFATAPFDVPPPAKPGAPRG
jgi:hypothetical protein